MNTKPFFLPSEVARLVLGYLISHGFDQTTRRFLMECSYLEEYKKLKSMGFEYPTNILGLSLVEILDNFGFMKTQALERYNLMASTDVLWRELDSCLDKLKYKLLQTNTNKLNCAKIRSQRKFPDKNVKILPENIGEILLKQGKVLSSKQLANTIKKVHETISTNESIKENHTLPNGNVDIENADLADEDVLSVSLVDDKEISDATNENKDVIQGIKEAKQNLFRNNQQQKKTVINKEQIISTNNNQNKDGQILNVDGCTPIQNTKTVLVISSPNPKTNFSPAKTTSIPLIASTSQIDIQSIGTTNSSSCISTASGQESSSSDLNKPSATKLEVMTGQQPDVSVSLLSTNCSADNLQPTLSKPIYKSIGTQSDLSLMTTHEFTSSTPSSNKCDISSEVVQSTSVEIQVDTLSKVLSKSSVDKDLPSNANTLSSPLKVATVQDDQPVDPQLLNGHKLNPQPLNDHALDPQPLNDHALDPQPLNDHALDPQPLNDHALDPQPLNDHALDPQPLNDHALDPQPLNGHKLNPQPLNDHALDPQPLNDHTLDPQPLNDHALDPQPLNDHALDPQPLNDHALDPQPLNGQEAVEPQNISTCHENNQSTESFLKESELTTQATSLSLSSSPPPILLGIVSGISSSKNLPEVYKTPVKNPQNLVKSPPRENIQSESLNTPTREKNALFSESLLTPIKQLEFDNSKSKRKRYPPEKRFIDIPIPGSSQLRCESGNSQDGSHLKDSIPTFVEKVISETSLPEVLAETINRKLFGEVKSETLVKNCENKISEEGPKGECDRLMDEIMLTDFHMTKSDIDEVIHQTNSAGIPVLDDLLKLFASVSEEKDNISGDEDTEPMYNNMEFEELDSCSQSAQNRELKQTSSEDSSSNPNPSNNEKPIEAPTTFLQVVQKLCSNDPSSKSFSNQPSSNASPKTIDTILEHEQEELENSTPKILSTTETHAKDLQTLEAVNSLNNSKPNQTKSLETKDLSTDKHPTSCSRRTKVFSKGKSRKLMPVSIFNPSDQIIHNQEVPHSLASQPIITQESSPSTKTSHTHPDLTQSITASSSMKSPSNRTPIISQQQINETTAVSSQTNFSQSTTIHPSEDLSTSNTLTSICSSAKDTAPISATDPSKLPLEYSPVSSNPYLLTTTTTATTITANASVLKTNVDNSLLIEKPPLLSAPLIEPVTRFSASISQSNTVVSRVLQPQETASLNQFPVMYIIAPPAAPVPVQFSQAQLPPIETGSKPPQNNVPTIELDNGLKIPIRLKRARGRPRKIPPTKRSQPKLYNIAPNINTNPVSHPMKSIETVSRPMKTIETDLHLPSSEKVTLAFSNDNSWTIEMDPQSEKIVLQLKNPNTNQLLTYEMSAEQVKDHLAAFIGTSEITDYIVETMQSYKKAKPKTKPPILSRRRTAKTKVQNKCGDIRKGKQVRAGQSRDHLVVGGELGAGQSRDHLVVGGELGAGQSRDHLVVGGELGAGQSRDHLVVGGELRAGQSRDHLVVGGELRAGQSRDHLVVGGELGAGQSRDHLVVGGELGESFTPSTKSNRSMISCRSDRTEAKALNPENTEQNEECILYYATPLGKVEDFIRNTRTFFKGSPKQIMTSSPSTSPTIKPSSSSSSSQITRATTIPSSPSLATRATTIPSSSTLLSSLATKKSSSSSSSKRTLSSTPNQTKSPCLSEEPISIIEISDSSVSYLPSPSDCPSNKEVLPEDSAKGFLGQINALTSSSPVEAAANNSPCKNKDEIKNTDFPIKENEFLAIDILSTLCYNECSKTNHPEDTALQTSKPDSGHSLDDMSARSPAGCYRILMEDKSEAHSSDMSGGNLSVSQEDQEGSNSTYPVPFDKSCKISNETTKCSSPSLSEQKKKRLKMKPNEEKTSSQKKKTTTSSRKKSLDKSTHRKAKGQPVKRKLYEAFPDQEKTVNKICRTDIDLLLTKLHPDSLDGFDGNT